APDNIFSSGNIFSNAEECRLELVPAKNVQQRRCIFMRTIIKCNSNFIFCGIPITVCFQKKIRLDKVASPCNDQTANKKGDYICPYGKFIVVIINDQSCHHKNENNKCIPERQHFSRRMSENSLP